MLSTTVINKRNQVFPSEEPKGRKHFNQAHKRTSLFGSENEPQFFEDCIKHFAKQSKEKSCRVNNEVMNGEETYDTIQNTDLQESYQPPKKQNGQNDAETLSHKDELETENPLSASTISRVELADVNQLVRDDGTNKYMKREHLCENSQMVQNGKLDNNNNVEYLIQAVKERENKREFDAYKSDKDSFLTEFKEKLNSRKEYNKRGVLNAPWYTDPEEGIGSVNVRRENDRYVNQMHNLSSIISKSKSTTQQDFPRYSDQELKECRPKGSYYGNKESMDWPFKENNEINHEMGLNASHYHRSSAVIGQNFIEKFGLKTPSPYKKQQNDIPVAASMLRNSPYAFHG